MPGLAGWTYYKEVTLSRASGLVTDYQMVVNVGESSGASGADVHCNGHCLSNFDDLRFVDSLGNVLDYWIESISGTTPNQTATIWVEFNSIGTGATTFSMCYGKADAAAYSNGDDTFLFFDDFPGSSIDAGKWGATGGVTVADGKVTITAASTSPSSILAVAGAARLYGAMEFLGTVTRHQYVTYMIWGTSTEDGRSEFQPQSGVLYTYCWVDGAYTRTNEGAFSAGTEIRWVQKRQAGQVDFYQNTTLIQTTTTNTPDTAGLPYFVVYKSGSNYDTLEIKWIFLRNWLPTEPAWGSWGSETLSNQAPTAPTLLLCEGATNPTGITDTAPEFSAILNDPDTGDTLTHVAIQVATDSGFSNLVWDSGWLDVADVTAGNRCADVSYAGTTLTQNGLVLYWKIRAKDDDGEIGAYSDYATFRMATPSTLTRTETVAVADSISRVLALVRSEGAVTADSVQKALGIGATEAAATADAVNRAIAIGRAESVSAEDAVARAFGITRGESCAMTATMGNLSLLVAFPEVAALSSSAGFVLAVVRNYLEELSLGAVAREHVAKAIQENAALAEAIGRAIVKTMQGETLDASDSASFVVVKGLVEGLALSEQYVLFESLLSFYESASLADSTVAVALAKALAEAMPLAELLSRLHALAFAESAGLSEDVSRLTQVNRILGETLSLSDSATHAMVLAFVEALAVAESRETLVSKAISESFAVDDAKHFAVLRQLADSLALTDAERNTVGHLFAEAIAADDALLKAVTVAAPEGLDLAEERLVTLLKLLTETLPIDPSASREAVIVRALVEALACDDVARKAILKTAAEALAVADSKVASVAKFLSEALSIDDAVAVALAMSLVEALAADDATLKELLLVRGESLATSEDLAVGIGPLLVESLGLSDATAAAIARAFADALSVSDSSSRSPGKTLPEAVEIVDAATRTIATLRAEGMSLEDVHSAIFGKSFSESAELSAEYSRVLAAARLLSELAGMGDRLRIGGIWSDPQVKIITSILKATLTSSVTAAEVETSITKAALQAEVR